MPTESAAGSQIRATLESISGIVVHVELPLARWTTFRIGGPAELAVEVSSERALVRLLEEVDGRKMPVHLLGLGSNVLLPDDGLRGVVIRLVGELRRVRIRGTRVSAGAGAPLAQVARRAAKAGLAGLEALAGFPSTVGGAVYMNAGCYGVEIKDVLLSARLVERQQRGHGREGGESSGRQWRVSTIELEASYRSTVLARTGAVVTRALFELAPGEPAAILARIEELNGRRWAALPSGLGNAGSIFKNPDGDHAGRLIEAVGLKGRAIGEAQISPKHANVIVNLGSARAADVVALMRQARQEVERRFGVLLEPEIILTGPLRKAFEMSA